MPLACAPRTVLSLGWTEGGGGPKPAATRETPPAGPRRPLSFVPTDSPRCPTGGKTSNGVRRHGANLVSGQMLLQMFRRRPRSSVTGATCRRLPEVESGSCPCPSASASAPQALSSRSPALGHCPGGPQQPRIALRPAGVSLAVFTHCLAPDGAPRKAGCRVPGLSSVRTTTATPRFRCLLFPPNSFVIIYIFLKLPTSCFVTRRSQTPALASAVCRRVPGTRLAQAASKYLSLA